MYKFYKLLKFNKLLKKIQKILIIKIHLKQPQRFKNDFFDLF